MKKAILFILLFVFGMALFLRLLALTIPGARVTSWFRSPSKNKSIGGATSSWHMIGWGLDIVPVTGNMEVALRNRFPYVLNEGDHLHVAWTNRKILPGIG